MNLKITIIVPAATIIAALSFLAPSCSLMTTEAQSPPSINYYINIDGEGNTVSLPIADED
jgi:hypothetical protein